VTTIQDTTPWLLPIRKAATLTGVSKNKLYAWIAEGRLRACRVGAHMRVHKDDLAATIAALPRVGE
jgi:excisionase family DNA binding protein